MEAGASINLRWQMSGQCGTILCFRVAEKEFFLWNVRAKLADPVVLCDLAGAWSILTGEAEVSFC